MFKWLSNIFGDSNEKEIAKLAPLVEEINSLEPEIEALSDEQLTAKTAEFKDRISQGETPDDILPEAFACVRESAKRTLGQRHYDVQLIGGIVLHQGKIAEMKTGEGKTLVATLPIYLNALSGKGAHLVTVNDYLAKRDAQWMGVVYHKLGLSVASIQHDSAFIYDPAHETEDEKLKYLRPVTRKESYNADIVYGTNNEYGFDYLRDNMVVDLAQRVQRPFNYAIVDEVDNIFIDEARTPLIISAPAEESGDLYKTFAKIVPRLKAEDDYTIDEKSKSVSILEPGIAKVEKLLGIDNIYDPANYKMTRYMENALKAHIIFRKDRDYVVKDGEVVIVDDFTGRLMFGRRYSEGLHQSIEAKEGVKVQRESLTMATITFQNYFRLYPKLAGMTGTAVTEAEEFHKIYKLEVLVIPTNKPMIRDDDSDNIYKTEKAKFNAIVDEIEQHHKQNRPVLVGTVAIDRSEYLGEMLTRRGIKHNVLNAKYHEQEANIIAQAGSENAVTIATNMAGRGVDIMLGGNPDSVDMTREQWEKEHNKVIELGGLHIIGTERHEARRIDNQLRGRAGRQGDPGSSRFFLSLEDEVVRRFGGDRIKRILEWAGAEEDQPIKHRIINRAINSAQTSVEGYNFDIRKHLIDYDDVMNKQREIIYSERDKILSGADLKTNILPMVKDEIQLLIEKYLTGRPDDRDYQGLVNEMGTIMPPDAKINAKYLAKLSMEEVEGALIDYSNEQYEKREQEMGEEDMRKLERLLMLRTIDRHWINYLTEMESVRSGIGLLAYGQRDPLVAYKKEALSMYESLQDAIQETIVRNIYRASLVKPGVQKSPTQSMRANRGQSNVKIPVKAVKVGRNDPCPCGSGKKYKHCCGQ
ncbi:preprotein translocase subunit SecA [Chloroflexota bacterium]